jgi:hypothetical protein
MSALGVSKRDAVAIVHMVWWWCLDNALEGRIEVPESALKAATEWESDASELVRGLVEAGWLEVHPEGGWMVHDWRHYCGSLVQKRLDRKNFREKRMGSKRRPNGSRTGVKSLPTVSVSQSVSESTKDKDSNESVGQPEKPAGPTPEHLLNLWNNLADNALARVEALTEKRRTKCLARLREHPDKEFWDRVIQKLNVSDFLRGSTGWRASFDWLITNDNNVVKIVEGSYDNVKFARRR